MGGDEHTPGRIAAAVVTARWAIVVFWVAAGVAAGLFLPQLGGGSSAPVGDIVPTDAPALRVQERAIELFGVPAGSDVAVVQRRPAGLRSAQVSRQASTAADALRAGRRPGAELLGAIPLLNAGSDVRWNEHDTTFVDYLFISPDVALADRVSIGVEYSTQVGAIGSVTGSAPARLDQLHEIDDVLPWITLATILVIGLVVAGFFRSLLAPLVTLGTAGLAYVVATRVLAWTGEHAGFSIPPEIEPLLVVLLLGLVTDYSVFLLAQGRRELQLGADPREAACRAVSRVGPSVLVAGTIVAACSTALLVAQLAFFRTFGPGLAGCALVVTLVTVTLVPALLAILGRRLFGASGEPIEAETEPSEPPVPLPEGQERRERWRGRIPGTLGAIRAGHREAQLEGRRAFGPITARMLASRPVSALVVLLCVAGLGWAGSVALDARLGVSFIAGLPSDSPAYRAADQAAQGFTGGILGPTDIVLEGDGVGRREEPTERLRQAIDREPGVAATLGPSAQPTLDPTADAPRPLATRSGDAARIVAVFDEDPTSAASIGHLRDLQARVPALARQAGLPPDTRIAYAGETALAAQSVDAVSSDFVRIVIVIAAVTLLLLAIFLRALVAPVLLVAASALGYVAALGLTTLAVRGLYGDDQITYYVPLVGAVLLVSLGSDYNVLVAGRIRAESARRRAREALAVAVPQASRAITLAGLTLAATFAMLAIIPLRSFRELALLLTIGVLLDTVVVRSMLVPGLISLAGRVAWWPGSPRQRLSRETALARFAQALGMPPADAAAPVEATLQVLGARLGEREAAELGQLLPARLEAALLHDPTGEAFDADAFVERVAERTGTTPDEARRISAAVLGALGDMVPATEFDYTRAALSEDYAPLLG